MKMNRKERRKAKFQPTSNDIKQRIAEVIEFNESLKFKPLPRIDEFLKLNQQMKETGSAGKVFLSSWLNFFVAELKERIANKAVEVAEEKMKEGMK